MEEGDGTTNAVLSSDVGAQSLRSLGHGRFAQRQREMGLHVAARAERVDGDSHGVRSTSKR
jgi:hypothetical protein